MAAGLSGWSRLGEEKRSGRGGEMRWKGKESAEEGEGAACFEVSPRWPEEVKSHVHLQVNVQKKCHLFPEESSYTPHSWTTACDTLYCTCVKNLMVTLSKCWKQSSRYSCLRGLTFGCHMQNVIRAWTILGYFVALAAGCLHAMSCFYPETRSWEYSVFASYETSWSFLQMFPQTFQTEVKDFFCFLQSVFVRTKQPMCHLYRR